MAEYIKKDEYCENYCRCSNEYCDKESCSIWKVPAADVAPVRHGQWRCHGDCGVTECSVCGWSIEEYVGDYAYCPNCGAKMDGGVDDATC